MIIDFEGYKNTGWVMSPLHYEFLYESARINQPVSREINAAIRNEFYRIIGGEL